MRGTKIHGATAGIAALSVALGTTGSALAKPADNPAAPDQRRHRRSEGSHPTIVVNADSYIWAPSSSADGTTTGPSGG